jgi:endonuclease/exonuclease/phosphatase family metal-dependent hydrolase
MRQLGIIISAHDPDIICLQEVTPIIMGLLLAQEWTHQYYVTGMLIRFALYLHHCYVVFVIRSRR